MKWVFIETPNGQRLTGRVGSAYIYFHMAAPISIPKNPSDTERTIIAIPCPVFPFVSARMPKTRPAIPKPGGKKRSEIAAQMYPAAIMPLDPPALVAVCGIGGAWENADTCIPGSVLNGLHSGMPSCHARSDGEIIPAFSCLLTSSVS